MKRLYILTMGLLAVGSWSLSSCSDQNPTPETEEVTHPITDKSKAYVTTLFAYNPAPGQFVNTSVGTIEAAKSVLGKKGLVTLGGFGGNIVLGFDHTVLNREGDDLIVFGNAFDGSSEPGIVMVSSDINANGLADDAWYELRGENHNQEGTIHHYSITYHKAADDADIQWTDNKGESGFVYRNTYHTQSYFPTTVSGETISFTGTRLPNNIKLVDNVYRAKNLGRGYVDNNSTEYANKNGNQLDIENAMDEKGNAIHLAGIDFVKIYTAVNTSFGLLGEVSTEVAGVADLSLLNTK